MHINNWQENYRSVKPKGYTSTSTDTSKTYAITSIHNTDTIDYLLHQYKPCTYANITQYSLAHKYNIGIKYMHNTTPKK